MIQTIKPYGYIKKELVHECWTWRNKYFLNDVYGNIYEISYEQYKELFK